MATSSSSHEAQAAHPHYSASDHLRDFSLMPDVQPTSSLSVRRTTGKKFARHCRILATVVPAATPEPLLMVSTIRRTSKKGVSTDIHGAGPFFSPLDGQIDPHLRGRYEVGCEDDSRDDPSPYSAF